MSMENHLSPRPGTGRPLHRHPSRYLGIALLGVLTACSGGGATDPGGGEGGGGSKGNNLPSDPDKGLRSEVSQFGITWTFDKTYPTGRFANGDWWVVGPVRIIQIDPPSTTGTRIKNGSMLNPSPRNNNKQGYDNEMDNNTFVAAMNVALDVNPGKPLDLQPHSSLVSTISIDAGHQRPQVKGASILTVLPMEAEGGDFRPAYCGGDKSVKFNLRQLDVSQLRQIARVSSTPTMASVERMFERPWIDHIPMWVGRYLHPADNMPDYGRDLTADMGAGALMLHLDFTVEEKTVLLVRFVQLGIDLMGIVDDGGTSNWQNAGGHGSGRKWPILFAGMMLGDPAMKGIGSHPTVEFAEDGQTFYVARTGATINHGYGGYVESDIGMPEWGIVHSTDPSRDNKDWTATYRRCCTANCWNTFVLAARIMGAQTLWNHPALFDYQDRYIVESRARSDPSWNTSWTMFGIQMWDTYRKSY